MAKITVQNTDISVVKYNEEDYISLTDMARSQLQDEHGNIFAKMNTSAFIVEDKIHAIYENGKLYFQSYTIANQIFSLIYKTRTFLLTRPLRLRTGLHLKIFCS